MPRQFCCAKYGPHISERVMTTGRRVRPFDRYNMASDLPFTAMPDVELIVTKCRTATKADSPIRLPFTC